MIPEDYIGPGTLRAVNDDCGASLGVFWPIVRKQKRGGGKVTSKALANALGMEEGEDTGFPCTSLGLDSSSHLFSIVVFLWLTAFHWRHIFT